MKRLLAVLAVYTLLVLPAAIWATGSLTTPNVIFTKPNPVPTSLLDANWNAHAAYINAREITFGLQSNRPLPGTAGRYYFSTDQNGGTLFADNGTSWTQLAGAVSGELATSISSLTMANSATASATSNFRVFPGQATSDDTTLSSRVLMSRTSTITKTLAAWSAGDATGCLDTGSAAVFTWYHVFAINRTDTGVTDILCSTSTSPTMPTNYTKKRRIGSILTDWSTPAGSIYFFVQNGDHFEWATKSMALNVNNAAPGTNANTATLTTPNGVITQAFVIVGSTANTLYVSPLTVSDEASTSTNSVGGTAVSDLTAVMTDTAQRFRYRSSANVLVTIGTAWYIDRRGQQ